jgi:hypothetical protein
MKLFSVLAIFLFAANLFAQNELIIHTAEFGVGKFHRADNKAHAYGASNAWAPYVLADSVTSNDKPTIQKNMDGSFTVFFSTLDEMMASVVQISQSENRPVSVLNVHGHGLPGAMWFPKDAKALAGFGCSQWLDAATGSDEGNLQQYYSPVSASEVRQIRQISNNINYSMPCTTGLKEWQAGVQKYPIFKTVLATDAQVHFLSCVVGLGTMGDAFTKGMATLLLPSGKGHVETSMNFGLGDWSMPAGMGFWDYISDAQLEHDNALYPVDHKDAELAQPGTIRIATLVGSTWATSLLSNQSVMPLSFDNLSAGTFVQSPEFVRTTELPFSVRIPGTNVHVEIQPL